MSEQGDLPDRAPDPPFVLTAEDRRRWELCQAIARREFGPDAAGVWLAARALFHGELRT